jgi:hypothetical protein
MTLGREWIFDLKDHRIERSLFILGGGDIDVIKLYQNCLTPLS